MATAKTSSKLKTDNYNVDLKTLGQKEGSLFRDYRADVDAHDFAISEFDHYEAMDNAKTFDAVSRETQNSYTDSATAVIYMERASRVCGQLPNGEIRAIGKKDIGKGMLMDILRQKWIFPNANAHDTLKNKMWMMQYYSSVYGYTPIYVDTYVSPSGYFGPDCWPWHPRNWIPQAGKASVHDMDYCHALTYESPKWFHDILENENTNYNKESIEEVINQIDQATRESDPHRDSQGARDKNKGPLRQVLVATRYESGAKGKWVTFLPEYNCKVIREIDNPHKNKRIPFVVKKCVPRLDSAYSVGDFQRSAPIQAVNDGSTNYYFLGLRRALYPKTAINSQTAIRHTIEDEDSAIWEFNGTPEARILDPSTAGLSQFQAVKGLMKGDLQFAAGTTDTGRTSETSMNPTLGRTPQALEMQEMREDTRDSQDREFLEEAMKEVVDLMLSIVATIKNKIPIDLFIDEIRDIIKAGYTDVLEVIKTYQEKGQLTLRVSESGKQLRLRLDPKMFEGLEYRFELEPNSTAKQSREDQLRSLTDYVTFITSMPNVMQDYTARTGRVFSIEKFNEIWESLTNLPGLSELWVDANQALKGGDAPSDPLAEQPTPTPPAAPPAPAAPAPAGPSMEEIAAQAAAEATVPPPASPTAEVNPVVPGAVPIPPEVDPLNVDGLQFSDPAIAAAARQFSNMRGR